MSNSLKNIFFSTRLMAVLFILFAFAMGAGTFIESEYSTTTAKIYVYNAWWFEVIMIFFVINFCGNIVRYRLYKKEKWSTLLIHLSFIFIILGAFVTRYIGYEGVMPIREGETENVYLSDKTYVTVMVDGEINGEPKRKTLKGDFLISSEGISASSYFRGFPWNNDFNGQDFSIRYKGFMEGAEEGLIEDENGEAYLKIVESGGGTRHNHFLKSGEVASLHNILVSLNKPTEGAININYDENGYTLSSPFEGEYMIMAIQQKGKVVKDTVQPLQLRSLYQLAGLQFVIPDPIKKGKIGVVETPERLKTEEDAITLEISSNGETQEVSVLGGKGQTNRPTKVSLAGLDFWLTFGADQLKLPFSVKLNDFIAERYPGTVGERGYKSFMSRVTINDENPFDYDIFMNHVLDHKGYRFFQASFNPDEKGTVLSVNHDYWGTWITYLGYFLLYAALMIILFDPNTRFGSLKKQLEKVKKKKAALLVLLFLGSVMSVTAQEDNHEGHNHGPNETHETVQEGHEGHDHGPNETHTIAPNSVTEAEVDSILNATKVAHVHAEDFGRLVIQDDGGRMKPVNTYARELVRKLSKSDDYKGLTANQAFLSMIQYPDLWYNVDFIHVKRMKYDSIRNIIGMEKSDTYAKAIDFFTPEGTYKLAPYLEDAYSTSTPNQYQKAFKEFDLRLGLLNRALSGEILRIFPVPNNDNNDWISKRTFLEGNYQIKDSLYTNYIENVLPYYSLMLNAAKKNGDYAEADKLLKSIKETQKKYGSAVLPSDKKIDVEIKYNQVNIFEKLMMYYLVFGGLMFTFIILQIFYDNKLFKTLVLLSKIAVIGLFILHIAGLVARWYISGHAPWSDAYESMIYIAWATMFFGVAFGRKSDLTLASTTFVASIILLGAHMNWLDPSIANLQPVLDSYWLLIHVAVIVGSYGPFALGAILGIVSLLLILFTTKKNKAKMELNLKEITIINEMALTVGLVMLTIGNFLGGMWANESWGRYWGWDPKETWALISIMVYAFVIHMRLVPGMRSPWLFNWISIIAFGSIMFTYFGVNFVLSGLHSYATGDAVLGLPFVISAFTIWLIYGGLSYWRYKVNYKK